MVDFTKIVKCKRRSISRTQ